jgi:ESX secretion-associated protein EspJ
MNDPLYVQPDGVRSYAQIHDEVVAGLSQVTGTAAPEAAGVQTSHGAIASAVSSALSGVLGSRQGTLQATGTSGRTISELLQKAAQLYEHGDQKGAATLRAAAEALEGSRGAGAPGSSGTSAPAAGAGAAGASGAGGGADMMGQMVQSVAQPLQGLAQGLQQLPQQVMQGAQQIAQQVSQAAGTAGDDDGAGPGIVPEGRFPEEQGDQAAAGDTAAAGRAPDLPGAERAEPAQTRPQSD